MSYRLHNDGLSFVDNSIDDAMVAPLGAVTPYKFKTKGTAHASGRLYKGSVDEFHRSSCHLFRQPPEGPLGGTRPFLSTR
jgi:hypothetical protein